MDIGKAIKLCRNQRSMTRTKLAKLAGISVSYLSLLENNDRDPSISSIKKIADALRVPVSILIFLASSKDELSSLDKELTEKLSYTLLELMHDNAEQPTLL